MLYICRIFKNKDVANILLFYSRIKFMNRRIFLEADKIREIANQLNKSIPTVYSALNFTTNSPLAKLIRSMAIDQGGTLLAEVSSDEVPEYIK
ncbi:hypothetical protein MASR1M31_03260 [Porphyromonadaceae bacterium]